MRPSRSWAGCWSEGPVGWTAAVSVWDEEEEERSPDHLQTAWLKHKSHVILLYIDIYYIYINIKQGLKAELGIYNISIYLTQYMRTVCVRVNTRSAEQ